MANYSIQKAELSALDVAFRIVEEYYEAVGVVARDTKEKFLEQYFGPRTGVWLALVEQEIVGCVALRELNPQELSGEIKRLYVRPVFRKAGIAQRLLNALESFAVAAGYKWLYLDSAPGMDAAVKLYQRNDYDPCPPYNDNPQAAIFLCKGIAQTGH